MAVGARNYKAASRAQMGTVSQVRAAFFDQDAILKSMDRAAAKALSRFGAFVRTRARSSIRKRKEVSKPGQPPTNRLGHLRNLIFFSYDRQAKSVVIGPILFPPAKQKDGPKLLEHGGTVPGRGRVIYVTRQPGRDKSGRFARRGKERVKLDGTLRYEPRPFMRPAFDHELPMLIGYFKHSL